MSLYDNCIWLVYWMKNSNLVELIRDLVQVSKKVPLVWEGVKFVWYSCFYDFEIATKKLQGT